MNTQPAHIRRLLDHCLICFARFLPAFLMLAALAAPVRSLAQTAPFSDPLAGPTNPPDFTFNASKYEFTSSGLKRYQSNSPSPWDRPMVSTVSGSFLQLNQFRATLTVNSAAGDLTFFGFGQGTTDTGYDNEPGNGFVFRIHNQFNNGGPVSMVQADATASSSSGGHYLAGGINTIYGSYPASATYVIARNGNTITLQVLQGSTVLGSVTYNLTQSAGSQTYEQAMGLTNSNAYFFFGSTYNNTVFSNFNLVIPPVITSATTAGGAYGAPFNYAITASNAPASYNATNLPPGLNINTSTGVISGTPAAAGSYSVTISASNPAGTGTADLSLSIAKATPTITTPPTASAITVGQTLASSSLSGGAASVSGSFAFTNPTTAPSVGTQTEGVTFTPSDARDFTTVTTTASVSVVAQTAVTGIAAPDVGEYSQGQVLSFTVTFSGPVTANTQSGTPTLAITIDGVTQQAAYSSGSGTNTLVFTYSVPTSGASAFDGLPGGGSISLNGGAIADSNGYPIAPSLPASGAGATPPSLTWIDSSQIALNGNFGSYTNGQPYAPQYQTGDVLHYSGTLPGWTASGIHAIHSVDLTGNGDYVVQIWQDNVLTSPSLSNGNTAGTDYVVSCVAGPAVQADPSQVTTAADGLVFTLLRSDGTTLASYVYQPGAWQGVNALVPVSFHYTGDGTGPLQLQISPYQFNDGHFGGELADLVVAPASAYNPSTITVTATSAAGAVENYYTSSYDFVDGDETVASSNPSGSTFGMGSTQVALSAKDSDGNTVSGTFTVNVVPATAEIDFATPSYTYNGSGQPAVVTTVPANLPVSVTYDGGSSTAPVSAGTHTAMASVSQTWIVGSAAGTVSIAAAPLTVTADPESKVYGSADPALTYQANGFQGTDAGASVLGGALTRTPGETVAGGPYAISQGSLTANSNYSIAFAGSTLAITPAAASVAPNAATKVFGTADPALTGTSSGFLASDNVATLYTRTAGENVLGSPYTIGATLSAAAGVLSNYTISYGTASFAITPATPSVSVTPYNLTYDGNAHTATGTATGVGGQPIAGLSLSGTRHTNAGGYTDSWAYTDSAGNYFPANGTVSDVIAKRNANPQLANLSATYGATIEDAVANTTPNGLTVLWSYNGLPLVVTAPAGGSLAAYSAATGATLYVGVVGANNGQVTANGDGPYPIASDVNTAASLSGLISVGQAAVVQLTISADGTGYTFAPTLPPSAAYTLGPVNQGTYTVVGTVQDPNYTGQVTATWTITAAPITVTADQQTEVYGSSVPALTYAVSGLVGSDTQSSVLTGGLTRAPGTAAGSYAIAQGTLAAASNYALNFNPGTLTITPATLAVAANPQTKVYGSADPALAYAVTGFQYSDTAATVLTGGLSRTPGETVAGGPYAISQGSLAANSNYTIAFAGSALNITPAPATINVSGYTGIYDGTIHGATGTASGPAPISQTANLNSLLSFSPGFGNAPGGSVNWSFNDPAGNYQPASGTVQVILSRANPTVSVTPYMVTYDGNAHTAMGAATGVGGVALSGLSLSATTHTNSGTYSTDAWTFADATGNYNTASGTVSDSIGQRPASVTPNAATKGYGAVDPTLSGTLTGFVASDHVSSAYSRASGQTVGTYTISAVLSPASALGNYSIAYGTAAFTITRGTPTLTWANPAAITYGTALGAAQQNAAASYTSALVNGPVAGNFTYSPSAGSNLTAGIHTLSVTFAPIDAVDYMTASASVSLKVNAASGSSGAVVTPYTVSYDGNPHTATASFTGLGGVSLAADFNLTGTTHTLPGVYTDTWTFTDPNGNYTSASGTIIDVIDVTALVRQGITLDGGIDGSVQVLTGTNDILNGNAMVSGNLLVPGTPKVTTNGPVAYGGVISGGGASAPTNYNVTLNGNFVLKHLVEQTNPIAMPTVSAPPEPTGTQSISINHAGQSAPNWATADNVTLNGNVGSVAMPAGTYGNVNVGSNSTLVLGVAGATTPSVYNLQGLTVNGNGGLQVVGPVVINCATTVSANGNVGIKAHPEWLTLNVSGGGVTLNGNVLFYGNVVAPTANQGQVVIDSNATLYGTVTSDSLLINGNGLLEQP